MPIGALALWWGDSGARRSGVDITLADKSASEASVSHPAISMASYQPLLGYVDRQRILETALEQSTRNALYVTALDGTILLSEGGFLAPRGLGHNETVGRNVRDFDGYPEWAEAKRRILAGGERVTLLVHHDKDRPVAVRGVWLEVFTPRLTPSGREVLGIIVNAVRIDGVEAFGSFSVCPLGACLVDPLVRGS
jgi:hypothetical protein